MSDEVFMAKRDVWISRAKGLPIRTKIHLNHRGSTRNLFLLLGRARQNSSEIKPQRTRRTQRESRKEERGLALAAGSLLRPGKRAQLEPRLFPNVHGHNKRESIKLWIDPGLTSWTMSYHFMVTT